MYPLSVPAIPLSSGLIIPQIGLGTYKSIDAAESISYALKHGYRLIDTAWLYENEADVGRAMRESGVPRNHITVATKVWPNYFGSDLTRRSVERSLRDLGVDTIDLLFLHWPGAHSRDAWKALERCVEEGLAKAIAVSNFTMEHLEELSVYANIAPVIDQIELHPYFQQRELCVYLREQNIAVQAYTPIGRGQNGLFDEPAIQTLCAKYQKTPAQIILRWHVQHGIIALPKSIRKKRLVENIDLFDFSLTENELAQLDALDRPDGRIGHDSNDASWLRMLAARPL